MMNDACPFEHRSSLCGCQEAIPVVGWHETTGYVDIAGNFLPAVPAGHLWVEAGSSVILSPEINSSMDMSDML